MENQSKAMFSSVTENTKDGVLPGFSSFSSGGRDIMSIVMQRRLGSKSALELDTSGPFDMNPVSENPPVKKTKLTDHTSDQFDETDGMVSEGQVISDHGGFTVVPMIPSKGAENNENAGGFSERERDVPIPSLFTPNLTSTAGHVDNSGIGKSQISNNDGLQNTNKNYHSVVKSCSDSDDEIKTDVENDKSEIDDDEDSDKKPLIQTFSESDTGAGVPFSLVNFRSLSSGNGSESETHNVPLLTFESCYEDNDLNCIGALKDSFETSDDSEQAKLGKLETPRDGTTEDTDEKDEINEKESQCVANVKKSSDESDFIVNRSEPKLGRNEALEAGSEEIIDDCEKIEGHENKSDYEDSVNCGNSSRDGFFLKDEVKKSSRKQYKPKRLPFVNDASRNSAENQIASGKFSGECRNPPEPIADSQESNADAKAVSKQKLEKSRKQYNPQRVVQDSVYDGLGTAEDMVKCEKSDQESDSDHSEDENSYDFKESCIKQEMEEGDETYNTMSDGTGHPEFLSPKFNFARNFNHFTNLFPPAMADFNHVDKRAWQNSIMLNLTQNLFQGTPVPDKGTEKGIGSIEENLEVVRKLREIRFNRYRKITIAEKKEIAAYAKINGVSSAATHFGVSKSAVSMWTRIDFSGIDEEQGKRKRNCMLGNEKFEELVQRVKAERSNKFKGLTKQEKFEVSRYAKLVGVREMARCLGIALGTVSGWMRQFPYTCESTNQNEDGTSQSKKSDLIPDGGKNDVNERETALKGEAKVVIPEKAIEKVDKDSENETVKSHKKEKKRKETLKEKVYSEKKSKKENRPGDNETENNAEVSDKKMKKESHEFNQEDQDSNIDSEKKDEVDKMIAETLQTPDIDKCYAEIQDLIYGTPLQNDEVFEHLFRRVLLCRADKYKYLKASEKLEVVRYAKRNGVRKIAKILGLATGTLSGWNTKYQAHLALPLDDSTSFDGNLSSVSASDVESSEAQNASLLSESFGNFNVSNTQSPSMISKSATPLVAATPSQSTSISPSSAAAALLDNPEKSEVTAIKFLLKERFHILLKKIEIARKIKFRNITPDEKIEIVKCAKLVGIRPTARVLNMPIGTLSGWISKYTNDLHPVYHVEGEERVDPVVSKPGSDSIQMDTDYLTRLNMVMGSYGASEAASLGLPFYGSPAIPAWPMMNRFGAGLSMAQPETTEDMKRYADILKSLSEQPCFKSAADDEVSEESASNQSDAFDKKTDAETKVSVKTETSEVNDAADKPSGKNFEEEAKAMAEQFLKNAYGTFPVASL